MGQERRPRLYQFQLSGTPWRFRATWIGCHPTSKRIFSDCDIARALIRSRLNNMTSSPAHTYIGHGPKMAVYYTSICTRQASDFQWATDNGLSSKGGSEVFQSLNIHIGIYVYTRGVELAKNTIYCLNIYKPMYINILIHTAIMRTYIGLTRKFKSNNNIYMRIYRYVFIISIQMSTFAYYILYNSRRKTRTIRTKNENSQVNQLLNAAILQDIPLEYIVLRLWKYSFPLKTVKKKCIHVIMSVHNELFGSTCAVRLVLYVTYILFFYTHHPIFIFN